MRGHVRRVSCGADNDNCKADSDTSQYTRFPRDANVCNAATPMQIGVCAARKIDACAHQQTNVLGIVKVRASLQRILRAHAHIAQLLRALKHQRFILHMSRADCQTAIYTRQLAPQTTPTPALPIWPRQCCICATRVAARCHTWASGLRTRRHASLPQQNIPQDSTHEN